MSVYLFFLLSLELRPLAVGFFVCKLLVGGGTVENMFLYVWQGFVAENPGGHPSGN